MILEAFDDPRNQRILALWIFRDEIEEAPREGWNVPPGQKVGVITPLHKHEGFLEVTDGGC